MALPSKDEANGGVEAASPPGAGAVMPKGGDPGLRWRYGGFTSPTWTTALATPLKILRAIVICTALWIGLASSGSPAFAQELEPRRWSHLPIGQNFASLIYARTEADISFDPELGIEDAQAMLTPCLPAMSGASRCSTDRRASR
jgi:hypothetical protein